MLYQAYQAHSDVMVPVRALAGMAMAASGWRPVDNTVLRNLTAAYELIARSGLTHQRPPFGIDHVTVGNREVRVTEEAALATPFATLLHFKKDIAQAQPRVLLVAPLSGHFATLLRSTVRTMLPEHDVYVTDWHNARDVPTRAGRFGFDDYTGHLIRFLETIGPGAHMLAVCQPCVAALVAAAVMAQDGNPAQPHSMTLMAGPIDCRVNPTKVNELANSLKPVVLPGEIMKVFILKEGKEYNQGVAYLDDGTMVVVDNARKMISKTIDIVVTSVLQTTAGKMIFGRYIEPGMAAPASSSTATSDSREENSSRRPRTSPQPQQT